MKMKYGNKGKKASKKGGGSVSMAQVGNVVGGAYSDVSEGMSLSDYNCRTRSPGKVAGSHRKTLSVGVVRGSHRKS